MINVIYDGRVVPFGFELGRAKNCINITWCHNHFGDWMFDWIDNHVTKSIELDCDWIVKRKDARWDFIVGPQKVLRADWLGVSTSRDCAICKLLTLVTNNRSRCFFQLDRLGKKNDCRFPARLIKKNQFIKQLETFWNWTQFIASIYHLMI